MKPLIAHLLVTVMLCVFVCAGSCVFVSSKMLSERRSPAEERQKYPAALPPQLPSSLVLSSM